MYPDEEEFDEDDFEDYPYEDEDEEVLMDGEE